MIQVDPAIQALKIGAKYNTCLVEIVAGNEECSFIITSVS